MRAFEFFGAAGTLFVFGYVLYEMLLSPFFH